jgi:hypothetical protein
MPGQLLCCSGGGTIFNVLQTLPADDERLDGLLDSLERKHPDPQPNGCISAGCSESGASFGNENAAPRGSVRSHAHAGGGAGKKDPLGLVSAELERARSGVAGLERRLRRLHAH